MRTLTRVLTAALAALAIAPAAASAAQRDVLFVGNNWDGTADVVDPVKFERIARLNIIPDIEERMAEIRTNPERQAYFLAIRQAVGEGHDQFVDDMYSSPDGRFLYVSRPSLADVIALDLTTQKLVWRTKIDGNRSDHMAISPDGSRLLVSASTAKNVNQIDTATGKIVGRFESGDQPHENVYSRDGSLVFHASIGQVFSPQDDPAFDGTKGERFFQVVDTKTNQVVRRINMGQKLEEFGRPGMSAAVRPMTFSPDERFVYFQVSFFHGFVEYDLLEDRVTRVAELPISDEAKSKRRDEYLLDSAHHGLNMSFDGTKLCVAGTVSDYAAIVTRDTFRTTIASQGKKPYWSTNSGDGQYCFVSYSGDDAIVAISYATEKEVARIPVGFHPQRMRMGAIDASVAGGLPSPNGPKPAKPSDAAKGGRLFVSVTPRRVRAKRPVTLRVRVTSNRVGKRRPVAGARVSVGGAAARTDPPDLMLLDVSLGDEDGLAVLEALRADGGVLPATVAMTGHDDAATRARCLAAGCVAVLLKPVPTRELLRVVDDLVPS